MLSRLSSSAWAAVIMQAYSYWIMGVVFLHGKTQARAVGFFKCVQSAGWSLGFVMVPQSRVPPIFQLLATIACYFIGVMLAMLGLPSADELSRVLPAKDEYQGLMGGEETQGQGAVQEGVDKA
jgi:hypothetical protein